MIKEKYMYLINVYRYIVTTEKLNNHKELGSIVAIMVYLTYYPYFK